jgi:hypothetical protein
MSIHLPETDEEFVMWSLDAPSQGYEYLRPNTINWENVEREWLRAILNCSPERVQFEMDGYFHNSMIVCWKVRVNGVSIGRIIHHEYLSLMPHASARINA